MPDYRTMFDSDWLHHYDLWAEAPGDDDEDAPAPKGKDVVVIIEKVEAGELMNAETRQKTRKPVVYFRGKKKALALNKTNGKSIAGIYGTDTAKWIGNPVALYKAKADSFGKVVPCIRIRPKAPTVSTQPQPQHAPLTPAEIAEGRDPEAEAAGA